MEFTGASRGILLAKRRGDSRPQWRVVSSEGLDGFSLEDSALRPYMNIVSSVKRGGREIFIYTNAYMEAGIPAGGAGDGYHPDFLICIPLRVRGKRTAILYADGRGELPPRAEGTLRAIFSCRYPPPLQPGRSSPGCDIPAVNEGKPYDRPIQAGDQIMQIIGFSEAMREVRGLVAKAAGASVTVLIEGETGTGKEIVARAIHYTGPRKRKTFLAQNCAAIPPELLESELFGYARGAFTGAVSDKKGLLCLADGGSVFLDEIGECPLPTQAKLLRVLENRIIRPVGGTREIAVDLRIIAATNRDLEDQVRKGNFRKDLYYRINVFPIQIPPLRERKNDIPVLAQYFLRLYSRRAGKNAVSFTDEALGMFKNYDFMGNVRELENEVARIVAMVDGDKYIKADMLSPKIKKAGLDKAGTGVARDGRALKTALRDYERDIIAAALASERGNISQTARRLGLSRYGLYKKLIDHNIRPGGRRGLL